MLQFLLKNNQKRSSIIESLSKVQHLGDWGDLVRALDHISSDKEVEIEYTNKGSKNFTKFELLMKSDSKSW